jgi:hypothetical protein
MDIGRPIHKVYLSLPAQGKHLTFPGQWLHGAPFLSESATPGEAEGDRITFLVNLWINHHPANVERLNENKLKRIKTGYCK